MIYSDMCNKHSTPSERLERFRDLFLKSFDSVCSAQGEHCCPCCGQRLCVGFCDVAALLGIVAE